MFRFAHPEYLYLLLAAPALAADDAGARQPPMAPVGYDGTFGRHVVSASAGIL